MLRATLLLSLAVLAGCAIPQAHDGIANYDFGLPRSDKETVHLVLAFEGGAPAYEPGDSLDLYPQNDPAEVDELLKAREEIRTSLTSAAGPRSRVVRLYHGGKGF